MALDGLLKRNKQENSNLSYPPMKLAYPTKQKKEKHGQKHFKSAGWEGIC